MKHTLAVRRLLQSFLTVALMLCAIPVSAQVTSGPQKMTYNGHLLDSDGDPVTTQQTIRFSFWNSTDYSSGDVTGTGAIHTAASGYADWYEEQTFTPDSNGYFSVQMGSGTALPDFSTMSPSVLNSLYLQVEMKVAGSADTTYEFLDVNSSDTTVDRAPVQAVPFSLNADTVDQRHVGTGSGTIPVLQSGGLLGIPHVPGATQSGTFTIDVDDSESGDISLQFGGTLSKKLSYDQTNGYFKFNDDVHIQGDLTVTGLIKGIDITNLATYTGSQLRVSSGGGLNVNVAAGGYRLSSSGTYFEGDSGITLSDDASSYVFLTSTGINVSEIGFPTNHSYIPLAKVTTLNGGVKTVDDRRVMQSDDRERSKHTDYHPEFEHATFQGDATNNVGQLYATHDSTNKRNYYLWTSTITSLQDYDVILRMTLPDDFLRWERNPLTVNYRTTSADVADNKMDIAVFDTNGTPVSLSGSTTDLVNTSWSSTSVSFTGSPTWTPGQDYLVKFTVYAKDSKQMHLGSVSLDYVEMPR